jgi:hypothetical protein
MNPSNVGRARPSGLGRVPQGDSVTKLALILFVTVAVWWDVWAAAVAIQAGMLAAVWEERG